MYKKLKEMLHVNIANALIWKDMTCHLQMARFVPSMIWE